MIKAVRITYFAISKADSRSLKVLCSLESLETFKNNGAKNVLFQASLSTIGKLHILLFIFLSCASLNVFN